MQVMHQIIFVIETDETEQMTSLDIFKMWGWSQLLSLK